MNEHYEIEILSVSKSLYRLFLFLLKAFFFTQGMVCFILNMNEFVPIFIVVRKKY